MLILLGIISGLTFTRFDFTKEKRFTISPISRNIMDSLKAPVKVTVYLKGDNFPAGMKRLQRGNTRHAERLAGLQHMTNCNLNLLTRLPVLKTYPTISKKQVYDSLAGKRNRRAEPTV